MPHTPEQRRAHEQKPEVKARRRSQNSTPEAKARRAARYRARRQNPERVKRDRAQARKYYWTHRTERLARQKEEYRTRPEVYARRLAREKTRKRSEREFQAGRPRPNVCDVCGRSDGHIDFDHCHQKGHFRGWLCKQCNTALGLVEDNPSILLKLIAYLKRTSNGVSRQMSLPGI